MGGFSYLEYVIVKKYTRKQSYEYRALASAAPGLFREITPRL